MAFISGTAPSYAGIVTAIISGCVANGWTNVGNVIYKGNCFIELTSTAAYVQMHGGTGQSGGVLTGKSTNGVRLGAGGITFPIKYDLHIFTNPDEVYFIMNYAIDFYQQLSFGVSDVAGSGGSPWFTSAFNSTQPLGTGFGVNIASYLYTLKTHSFYNVGSMAVGLFIHGEWNGEVSSSFAYSTVGGTPGWYGQDSGPTSYRLGAGGSASQVASLMSMLPNYFNSGMVLLPIRATLDLGSNGRATLVSLNNVRFCRLDNNNPGDILTYGTEQWKLYPWLKRDTSARNGGNNFNFTPPAHSGTYGYAIRYTGG